MSAQGTRRDGRKAAVLPAVGSRLGFGVSLATLIPMDQREVPTRWWTVPLPIGGSLLFLGVLLVTLALPAPGAGMVPRDPLITAASILFYASGFASVATFLPSMRYINQTGELPEFRGIRFYGDALFERLWGVGGSRLLSPLDERRCLSTASAKLNRG